MYLRFPATRGHQKNFRYDFRNLQVRNRGIKFENKKNLEILRNRLYMTIPINTDLDTSGWQCQCWRQTRWRYIIWPILVTNITNGDIDVGDGCWRQHLLVTSLRCWWPIWYIEKSHQHNDSATTIIKSPTSKIDFQGHLLLQAKWV